MEVKMEQIWNYLRTHVFTTASVVAIAAFLAKEYIDYRKKRALERAKKELDEEFNARSENSKADKRCLNEVHARLAGIFCGDYKPDHSSYLQRCIRDQLQDCLVDIQQNSLVPRTPKLRKNFTTLIDFIALYLKKINKYMASNARLLTIQKQRAGDSSSDVKTERDIAEELDQAFEQCANAYSSLVQSAESLNLLSLASEPVSDPDNL